MAIKDFILLLNFYRSDWKSSSELEVNKSVNAIKDVLELFTLAKSQFQTKIKVYIFNYIEFYTRRTDLLINSNDFLNNVSKLET